METAFEADFSDIRVHHGPQAESMGALAFTQGQDIHFARGQYDPGSRSGRKLIGHELAHVVQQRAGKVAMPDGDGPPINASPELESEADALGANALQGGDVGHMHSASGNRTGAVNAPIQAAPKRPPKKGLTEANMADHDAENQSQQEDTPFNESSAEMSFDPEDR
jgi:hypothetical protein